MKHINFNDITRLIPLNEVAEKLGMQVKKKGNSNVCLCPFHDDTHPSLHLYDSAYHCYACGSHGNVFNLVEKMLDCDFKQSYLWLKQFYDLPEFYEAYEKESSMNALELALKIFKNTNKFEKEKLSDFAKNRGFDLNFFNDYECFYVSQNKLLNAGEIDNIDKDKISRCLEDAELIRNSEFSYGSDRIVITLRDINNVIMGYAGRAMSERQAPKYLFTKNLPKGKFLYNLNRVLEKYNKKSKQVIDLYLTEGIFDALRLSKLGFDSAAVLGNHLTVEQVEGLEKFRETLAKSENILRIHIFMDWDDAGLKGSLMTLKNILMSDKIRRDKVDVVANIKKNIDKEDPDTIFKGKDYNEVNNIISENIVGIFDFLTYMQIKDENYTFEENVKKNFIKLREETRILKFYNISNFIPLNVWKIIISLYAKNYPTFGFEYSDTMKDEIVSYFELDNMSVKQAVNYIDNNSLMDKFSRAVEIAYNSYLYEDVPLDKKTWERIRTSADVMYKYFLELLWANKHFEIPALSIYIPKNSAEYRLKKLPCHENLILQQFVLNELLKSQKYLGYEKNILAVRYSPEVNDSIYTTGLKYHDFYNNECEYKAVSFAYQINMTALNGNSYAEQGMFRPFYECWKSYINFVTDGIREMEGDNFYRLKLDISKFYDNISYATIKNAISEPIKAALKYIEPFNENFNLIDWLLKEAFGQRYIDSGTGKINYSEKNLYGLQQAPNLSAYFANISLFELDMCVVDCINKINSENDKTVIRYARYVDDMIIISTNSEYIKEIHDLISNNLFKMNLELSNKTDRADNISREELMEWLNDAKGGLRASTSEEDIPIENEIDEISYFDSMDRNNTLNMLKQLRFNFTYSTEEQLDIFDEAIKNIFKTKEIKYNDLIRLSELIIRKILNNTKIKELDINIYDEYIKEWYSNREVSLKNSIFMMEGIEIACFIRACQNILRRKNTFYTINNDWSKNQDHKKSLKNHLNFGYLVKIIKNAISENKDFIVRNEMCILFKLIDLFLECEEENQNFINDITGLFNDIYNNEYKIRWKYTYDRNIDINNLQNDDGIDITDEKILAFFYRCIHLLKNMEDEKDFTNIQAGICNSYEYNSFIQHSDNILLSCIANWFSSNESENEKTNNVEDSLNIFVNVVHSRLLAKIVSENEIYKKYIFKFENKSENNAENDLQEYLPIIPGVNYPGIIARKKSNVIGVLFGSQEKSEFYTNKLYDNNLWTTDGNKCNNIIKKYKRTLNDNVVTLEEELSYKDEIKDSKMLIKKIKEIHCKIMEILNSIKSTENLVISSRNVLINETDKNIVILGFYINDKSVSGYGKKYGNNGTIFEHVNEVGKNIWIAGKVIFDALGYNLLLINNKITENDKRIIEYMYNRLTGEYAINEIYLKSYKSIEATLKRVYSNIDLYCSNDDHDVDIIFNILVENSFIKFISDNNLKDTDDKIYFLTKWAKLFMSVGYKHVEILYDSNLEDSVFSFRRTTEAYYILGCKLLKKSDNHKYLVAIKILATSLLVNSIAINLRSQVLELYYNLSTKQVNALKNENDILKIYMLKLGIDNSFVMDENDSKVYDIYKDLFNNLINKKHDTRITGLTINGLLVLLACVYFEDENISAKIINKCKEIIYLLDVINYESSDEGVFPFNKYENICNINSSLILEKIKKIHAILWDIDKINGIEIKVLYPKQFYCKSSKDGILITNIDGKEYKRAKGFFTYISPSSSNFSYEKFDDEKYIITVSKSKNTDDVLGVTAIEDRLSKVIFSNISNDKKLIQEKINISDIDLKDSNIGTNIVEKDSGEFISDSKNEIKSENVTYENINSNIDSTSNDITKNKDDSFKSKIGNIIKIQRDSWTSRKKIWLNYGRIAILQLDVDDSYKHFEYDECTMKENRNCAEYRRIEILKEVFISCDKLGVEILILPEYSVRPSTVEWILDEIDKCNYEFSVWAGTFKFFDRKELQKPYWGDMLLDYAAYLPIVFNNKPDNNRHYFKAYRQHELKTQIITSRTKKYPAVALNEDFNPLNNEFTFEPVLKKFGVLFGDVRDDVTELICAEMFLINSPANIKNFAYASFNLYKKYFGNTNEEDYIEKAFSDVKEFGKNTGLYQDKDRYSQKSIILVPAYTTRAMDYYVSAQANYLASGLTVVFCNAVSDVAKGGSCFIGQNSCDKNKKDTHGYVSIYNGLEPGMYSQYLDDETRGPLGAKEQALLVYDVNTKYSFKGQPNPESMGEALKLVAHLPIIECNITDYEKYIDEKKDKSREPTCRCRKEKNNKCIKKYNNSQDNECNEECKKHCNENNAIIQNELIKLCENMEKILNKNANKDDDKIKYQEKFINPVSYSLEKIGVKINSEWLIKRGKFFKENEKFKPSGCLPPTAFDWIYVEIDYSKNNIAHLKE